MRFASPTPRPRSPSSSGGRWSRSNGRPGRRRASPTSSPGTTPPCNRGRCSSSTAIAWWPRSTCCRRSSRTPASGSPRAGLSAVVTDEAVRGRGHGTTLVAEARRLLEAEADADLGIFTCDRGLQRFYERAGWEHLPGAVLVGGTPDDPFPSDGLGKVTLAAFFTERARAAAPTFVGARIALYPGRIDRLW
jgi:hypothetical protein